MYSISDHTTQISGWIALTKSRKEFSHSLDKHGYECDFIEKSIEIEGEEIKPDVVLSSPNENHTIVVECKGEGIDRDQFNRYQLVYDNQDELMASSRLINGSDPKGYLGEVCYSSFSDLSIHSLLLENESGFVHFQKSTTGVFLANPCQFQSKTLCTVFPINMNPDEEIPSEYYPFDIDQPEDYPEFVSAIIQGVLRTSMRDGVLEVESVLHEAHPFWEHISEEKQERYISMAKKVMVKLEREELMEFIENVAESDGEWRIHHKTADAIQDRLHEPGFIENIAQFLTDQQSVDEF